MRQVKLILFTDSKTYSREFAVLWHAKGYQLKHLPLLRAENTITDEQLTTDFDGVIITSTNAIDALQKYFPNQNIKIYTISKALADKIKIYGYQNIYFNSNGNDASSLAETFVRNLPQGTLVHLCGQRVRQTLNFNGVAIKTFVVYKMCEIAENAAKLKQIVKQNTDAVIYVSSEQVIQVLLTHRIPFDKVIFKSNYLKDFAEFLLPAQNSSCVGFV